ncbi:MAG: cob(I)yrinic acid a,c-diamide adenosyltransferase [Clostridia bacterium]|nr:cob(I)yrinic acid a,c-diamide adenosyltransferase [Clostridia bacterium]
MIHLYYGDGKGKTSAACGLAVRSAGAGMRVLFTQFFKNGSSSENSILSGIEGIDVVMPGEYHGRYKKMDDAQKNAVCENYRAFMSELIEKAGDYDLIVLDEAVSAYGYGMFGKEEFLSFLQKEGCEREIVLTGRSPLPELLALADYATEMKKVKHPFDRGITARKGIEF